MKHLAALIVCLLHAVPVSAQTYEVGAFTGSTLIAKTELAPASCLPGIQPALPLPIVDPQALGWDGANESTCKVSIATFVQDLPAGDYVLKVRQPTGDWSPATLAFARSRPPQPDNPLTSQVVDCQGNTWTISPQRATLRNGLPFSDLAADQYLLKACIVYAYQIAANRFYESGFNPNRWAPSPDPRTPADPSPAPTPPPAASNPCVIAPLIVTAVSWPTSAEGARQLRYTATVAGVVTTITRVDLTFAPRRLSVTDARGCSTVVQ